jgi:Domain of unknown function (DUF4412)
MTKFSILSILFFFQISTFAGSFEGKITFRKITSTDTTYFSYFVKGNHIRVDEHTKSEQLINSMLVDLNDSSLIAISPLRKMYMHMPVQPFYGYDVSNFDIEKTSESQKIAGYNCTKWESKNEYLKTKVDYFVVNDAFDFFLPFLKLTNRSEKSAGFFIQIPENKGYFPLKSIEYNLEDNKTNLILEVIQINKMVLDNSLFEIPSDYMHFEH